MSSLNFLTTYARYLLWMWLQTTRFASRREPRLLSWASSFTAISRREAINHQPLPAARRGAANQVSQSFLEAVVHFIRHLEIKSALLWFDNDMCHCEGWTG